MQENIVKVLLPYRVRRIPVLATPWINFVQGHPVRSGWYLIRLNLLNGGHAYRMWYFHVDTQEWYLDHFYVAMQREVNRLMSDNHYAWCGLPQPFASQPLRYTRRKQ